MTPGELPELAYNYQNGLVEAGSIQLSAEGTLSMRVTLYPVCYPAGTVVELSLLGVANPGEVHKFVGGMGPIEGRDAEMIEFLEYDSDRISKPGRLYVFMQFAYRGSITVECREFSAREQE